MAYGNLSILDTLAANTTRVAIIGEDRVWESLQLTMDAHNELVKEMANEFTEVTVDRLRRYGGVSYNQMVPADEFSVPDVQKLTMGDTVGFPLRTFQYAIGWTRRWLERATVGEVAAQTIAAQTADIRRLQREIKYALFHPTNYTFTDRLVDLVQLNVKALVNADGATIPPDPYGNAFDPSTHTHYLANATLTATALHALVDTVVEHTATGTPVICINRSQEATVRAMTPDFNAYTDSRLYTPITSAYALGSLDIQNTFNREIGIFGTAVVRVKPWVPNNYVVVYNNTIKPLVMRISDIGGRANLALVAESEQFPMRARYFEREYGIAPWNRTSAAVLYIGGGSYVEPVLTA